MGFFQGLASVAYGSDQILDLIPCDTVQHSSSLQRQQQQQTHRRQLQQAAPAAPLSTMHHLLPATCCRSPMGSATWLSTGLPTHHHCACR
jgi:hypothetical protein